MGVLDVIFPPIPVCVVCGTEKQVESYLCPACADSMAKLKAGSVDAFGFSAYAPYWYRDEAARIVQAYKYGGGRWLGAFMAQKILHTVCDAQVKIDCICHVPLHKRKRKKRGFDQARLLAIQIAEWTGKPHADTLSRIRNTPSQTKLDKPQRQQNMQDAFAARAVFGRVLLIDDVLTTGATAAECARMLMGADAQSVCVATFAQAEKGQ